MAFWRSTHKALKKPLYPPSKLKSLGEKCQSKRVFAAAKNALTVLLMVPGAGKPPSILLFVPIQSISMSFKINTFFLFSSFPLRSTNTASTSFTRKKEGTSLVSSSKWSYLGFNSFKASTNSTTIFFFLVLYAIELALVLLAKARLSELGWLCISLIARSRQWGEGARLEEVELELELQSEGTVMDAGMERLGGGKAPASAGGGASSAVVTAAGMEAGDGEVEVSSPTGRLGASGDGTVDMSSGCWMGGVAAVSFTGEAPLLLQAAALAGAALLAAARALTAAGETIGMFLIYDFFL